MTIATQLYDKAFHSTRDPRSAAYRAGVLDTLSHKESGSSLTLPYDTGTAEADAWHGGNQEGHSIWCAYQEVDKPANHERLRFWDQETSAQIIDNRALQLCSLLQCISGGGFDSFNELRDDLKGNVLWACRDLAEDLAWHCYYTDKHLAGGEK
jgi:hypothetical protein